MLVGISNPFLRVNGHIPKLVGGQTMMMVMMMMTMRGDPTHHAFLFIEYIVMKSAISFDP